MKVYVLLWKFNHKGEFDCGVSLHKTKKEAIDGLNGCYEQAIHNITPNGTKEELDMNECVIDADAQFPYYYVERYAADSWEGAELREERI